MGQSLKVEGYESEEIKQLFTEDKSVKVALRLFLVYQVALGYKSKSKCQLGAKQYCSFGAAI